MKQQLNNTFVKEVYKKNNKGRFRWAYNMFYIFMVDSYSITRVDMNEDLKEFMESVKEPSEYEDILKIWNEYYKKILPDIFTWDDVQEAGWKESQKHMIKFADDKYYFDKRFFSRYRTNKYFYEIFPLSEDGKAAGCFVSEYIGPRHEDSNVVAMILGVRTS